MSCLLFPEIEGIQVQVYDDFDQIDTHNLKCIVFFQTEKLVESHSKSSRQQFGPKESIRKFIERLGYNVAFGGGCIKATKIFKNTWPKQDFLRNYIIMTFSGQKVKCSSIVLQTFNKNRFLFHLIKFKSVLDFDCDDWKQSTTIAFIFANNDNFSGHFTSAFQSVFPCVGIFGFQSMEQMYGHYYGNEKTCSTRNKFIENIDPKRNSVIVLINFGFRKFQK